MSSHDDSVQNGEVLGLVQQLRKEGVMAAMNRVSEVEPVVMAYATAAASKLEEYASEAGLAECASKAVFREALLAQLVCVEAVRLGHLKLWQDAMPHGDANEPKGGG
jgi:hypothetical protein